MTIIEVLGLALMAMMPIAAGFEIGYKYDTEGIKVSWSLLIEAALFLWGVLLFEPAAMHWLRISFGYVAATIVVAYLLVALFASAGERYYLWRIKRYRRKWQFYWLARLFG
ncbi:MAG TPA: hypothetical protein PLW99_03490 [Candidatus Paceibacterota bacterium]|nr:MAG: hypothetical protein B7X03_01825 [Parcubacteria group bacterium 21-58-10]HQT83185.1 hypothetical protein [Candidatus Paceibacterota bacterium]